VEIPASDLANWLSAITPLGAPALAIRPEGPFVFGPCPLPLTAPREPDRPGLWLEGMLEALLISRDESKPARAIETAAQERIATILGGPRRPDGRPGWHPGEAQHRGKTLAWAYNVKVTQADLDVAFAELRASGQKTGVVRPTRTVQRGDRGLMRGVHLAVSRDIAAADPGQLSSFARLTDHQQFNQDGKGEAFTGETRSLRRLIAPGRQILSLLGAWPWAHVEGGVLPAGWKSDETFVEPLRAWHSAAVEEAQRSLNDLVLNFERYDR
jgi:hypothetical protein